jgi:hypothetical protein
MAASTFHNPMGLQGLLEGQVYFPYMWQVKEMEVRWIHLTPSKILFPILFIVCSDDSIK